MHFFELVPGSTQKEPHAASNAGLSRRQTNPTSIPSEHDSHHHIRTDSQLDSRTYDRKVFHEEPSISNPSVVYTKRLPTASDEKDQPRQTGGNRQEK